MKLAALLLIATVMSMASPLTDHTDHNRIGSHGMVLFTDGQSLYSSHLPLYRAPHDYQLIYQVTSDRQDHLMKMLADGMVTILPDQFDLNVLVSGKKLKLNTQVYQGHFERGGSKAFIDTSFVFQQAVFKRKISGLTPDHSTTTFHLVEAAAADTHLVVHAIQSRPSFDLILSLQNNRCELQSENHHSSITFEQTSPDPQTNWQDKLTSCGVTQVLYHETQDFK